jgi:hypothetical protein
MILPFFQMRASEVGQTKWGKNRKLFPHKTKKPATVITRLRVLAIIDLKIVQ